MFNGFSTCYQSKLSKHLKVCNAKIIQDTQPSYVVKGINLGNSADCINDLPLSEIDQELIDDVVKKIETAYGTIAILNIYLLHR